MSGVPTRPGRLRQRLARSARLLRTARHLKPVQILGRLRSHLPVRGSISLDAPPLRRLAGAWTPPIARAQSLLGRWNARFLNEVGEIAHAEQWNDVGKPKLWLYNLHYFDDLGAVATDDHRTLQRQLIDRWIAENPIGTGNGWEPYPTSLRIANWIKWAQGGAPLEARWRDSLSQQVRWLSRRIEWHLLGNHLLTNAKALTLAGLYFDGPEADAWLAAGSAILERELDEQILEDGGHFERSAMYHATILEDVLDLINAARAYGADGRQPFARLVEVVPRMQAWLAAMSHPDGEVAFFNDAAFAIAPSLAALKAYAARLGLPPVEQSASVRHLRSSGYVRLDRGPAALIADIGEIGPTYLPGHAHADTLSFELSMDRERIVVNSGTSTYAIGDLRSYQRSTAAHSTVEIDGADSSEMWSSFRVGRRARIREIDIVEDGRTVTISGAHDGYRYLRGRPQHRRSWRLDDTGLVVTDRVTSDASHACHARFHLGAGIESAIAADGKNGALKTAAGRTIAWCTSERARLVSSSWYPEFGKSIPSTCLLVPFAQECRTELTWST